MQANQWHFRRTDLTQKVFHTLTEGPSPALTLVAPRRTGKTTFLTQDLAPYARDAGHAVIYASFWGYSSPIDVLLAAFLKPEAGTIATRLSQAPNLKLKARISGQDVQLDLGADNDDDIAQGLRLIDTTLEAIGDPARPVILLLDEFQEVANAALGEQFQKSLRSMLDRRKTSVRSVFTGSSQTGLNRIFAEPEAAFYRFATQIGLPELGDDFVQHQLEVFSQVFRTAPDAAEAQQVFRQMGQNPMYFQTWLQKIGLDPATTPETALQSIAEQTLEQSGFDTKWLKLSPIHRALTRLIAEEAPALFGKAAAERLEALTGAPAPSPARRQSLMRLLLSQAVVDSWGRDWRLPDPLIRQWVLERPDSEFRA